MARNRRVGNLNVVLSANTRRFADNMRQSGGHVRQFGGQIQTVNRQSTQSFARMARATSAATTIMSGGFGSAASAAGTLAASLGPVALFAAPIGILAAQIHRVARANREAAKEAAKLAEEQRKAAIAEFGEQHEGFRKRADSAAERRRGIEGALAFSTPEVLEFGKLGRERTQRQRELNAAVEREEQLQKRLTELAQERAQLEEELANESRRYIHNQLGPKLENAKTELSILAAERAALQKQSRALREEIAADTARMNQLEGQFGLERADQLRDQEAGVGDPDPFDRPEQPRARDAAIATAVSAGVNDAVDKALGDAVRAIQRAIDQQLSRIVVSNENIYRVLDRAAKTGQIGG